jgi:polar amino acid transport system substrate-binding protein
MQKKQYISRRLRFRNALCCALLIFSKSALSEPEVYVDLVDPLAYSIDGVQQGLLYDLLSEMGRRVHHSRPIVPMPLERQRFLLTNRDDALGTLWRFPEIESNYFWWCKLFDSSFFMVATANSTVDISSVEAAKQLRVGVILGSPAELLARRLGFPNIQTSITAESNARKLTLGRIDIWIATPRVIKAAQTRVEQSLGKVRINRQIGKYGVYLASSPRFDCKVAEKWRLAFESMKKDGSFAMIKRNMIEFQMRGDSQIDSRQPIRLNFQRPRYLLICLPKAPGVIPSMDLNTLPKWL